MRTPTPYRVGRPGTVVADSAEGITINGGTGPENVKHYGGNLIAESVSPENAAFIVEACNAYDGHIGQVLIALLTMQGCTICQEMLPCNEHGNINETIIQAASLVGNPINIPIVTKE